MGELLTQPQFENMEIKFEMSASIGKLVDALAKAHKQFKPVLKESSNPFFKSKYADLASVIDATKDGMSDNGLAIIQPPAFRRATGTVEIITLLAHSSGEWIKAILDMPVSKSDAQGVGSAITYGRRYARSAVLDVASEEDDDGNAAVSKDFKTRKATAETNEDFDQRTADQLCISVEQIQAIDKAIKTTGKSEEEVVAALAFIGEKRIEHIKKNQFDKFLKWALGVGKKKPDTSAAMKALFATANKYKIPEQDVKQASYEKYNVASMTELSASQIQDMTKWVENVAEQSL